MKTPHYTDPGQPGHPDWKKKYGPEALRRMREAPEKEEPQFEEPKKPSEEGDLDQF